MIVYGLPASPDSHHASVYELESGEASGDAASGGPHPPPCGPGEILNGRSNLCMPDLSPDAGEQTGLEEGGTTDTADVAGEGESSTSEDIATQDDKAPDASSSYTGLVILLAVVALGAGVAVAMSDGSSAPAQFEEKEPADADL